VHSFSTLLRFIWRSSRRAAVFVVGVALVGVGLVMFVTPGPGIVLVVAGLAVLATEFAWAEHLLDKAKTSAAKAGQSAQKLPGVSRATAAARRLVPARWRRDGGRRNRGAATGATEEVEAASDGADTGAAASDSDTPARNRNAADSGAATPAAATDPDTPAANCSGAEAAAAARRDAEPDARTAVDSVADGEPTHH